MITADSIALCHFSSFIIHSFASYPNCERTATSNNVKRLTYHIPLVMGLRVWSWQPVCYILLDSFQQRGVNMIRIRRYDTGLWSNFRWTRFLSNGNLFPKFISNFAVSVYLCQNLFIFFIKGEVFRVWWNEIKINKKFRLVKSVEFRFKM